MNKIGIFLLPFLFLLTISLNAEPGIDFWSDEDSEVLTGMLLDKMTDQQMLGQMLLLGYMGGSPSREIIRWISEKEIGGVKIFGWNVRDLESLASSIAEMQQVSLKTEFSIPLFIVTDQEGGWVRHVHGGTSETSGNMALAASSRPDDSFRTGYYIGMELRQLGINMNFAPTVDVYSNPEAHVIGPRAFSDDPLTTSILSVAYYKGMDSAGIICTAKHFPGHGDADKDSHGALPVIDADFETLWNRDLLPYRYLVKEDIPAVMSGHLAFPSVTGSDIPASLSPEFLTSILRDKIGFEGLVITDDLMMNGVQLLPMTTAAICRAAIEAGNDIILISRTPEVHQKVWNHLVSVMDTEPDFRQRVRESARRILSTKLEYLRPETAVPVIPDAENVASRIPDPEGSGFFFDQAVRSATEVRSTEDGLKPQRQNPSCRSAGQVLLRRQENLPGS